MMGSLAFMVEGYDHDPREFYAILGVRRFYSAFHAPWPHKLYFCDLDQDSLKTVIMCCLPRLTSVARDRPSKVGVQLDPMELLRLVAADFAR